ncbi:MAG: family NAD(P)-dependent oxidoreductase [Pseudonocardiales bacterium]|nr:family NAD(P)-dependent oxidoreductase [Pseudonocardiales bacterium]
MTSPLSGTVALVTGASSGIGAATAAALAQQGAAVALVARRGDRLDELAVQISDAGGRALALTADITDADDAASAVARAVQHLGRLDIVVNNAGMMLLGPMLEAPADEWQRMIDINLSGLLHVTRALMPHLLRAAAEDPRQVADLVNISSVAGRQVRLGSGVYNATKHAVGALSESLRQEVTKRHVRVGLIEPGAVETELAGHNREEVLEGMRTRFAAMQRLVADDIAESIVYMVTRPRHMAVNEMLIRPTEQEA